MLLHVQEYYNKVPRLLCQMVMAIYGVGALFEILCGPSLGCCLTTADRNAGIDGDHLSEDVEDGLGSISGASPKTGQDRATLGTVLSYILINSLGFG
jgi:hypothetical protein